MRRVGNVVTAVAGILLVPSLVFAQATLAGVVRDTSAAVLPGVTVEASSPALIEKTRSVVSDGTETTYERSVNRSDARSPATTSSHSG